MISAPILFKEYSEHRELVDAYMKGDRTEMMYSTRIRGMSVGMFVILLIIFTAIWITCLYFLIRYWDVLPTWVKVVTILDMLAGTGTIGLVVMMAILYKTGEIKSSST